MITSYHPHHHGSAVILHHHGNTVTLHHHYLPLCLSVNESVFISLCLSVLVSKWRPTWAWQLFTYHKCLGQPALTPSHSITMVTRVWFAREFGGFDPPFCTVWPCVRTLWIAFACTYSHTRPPHHFLDKSHTDGNTVSPIHHGDTVPLHHHGNIESPCCHNENILPHHHGSTVQFHHSYHSITICKSKRTTVVLLARCTACNNE